MPVSDGDPGWATCTNARLRVAQGDAAGARRVLALVLERDPTHPEAQRLLAALPAATAEARGRRIERLARWLARIDDAAAPHEARAHSALFRRDAG